MNQAAVSELAPHGVLRAAINMSNPLLVTGRAPDGGPAGVAPDLATAIGAALGVPVQHVPFPGPGQVSDAAGTDSWDIALIGDEPARAIRTSFTSPYVEIEATYLVSAGSPLQALAEVDRPGIRIAVTGRSAYGLWLARNIQHATLVTSDTLDSAVAQMIADKLDALAGLRPRLLTDIEQMPGARILDGQFTAVQQAVGTGKENVAGLAFLQAFIEDAKASGRVARLIAAHAVQGLSVAPAAPKKATSAAG